MRLLALLAPCASALLFDEAAKAGERGGGGGDVSQRKPKSTLPPTHMGLCKKALFKRKAFGFLQGSVHKLIESLVGGERFSSPRRAPTSLGVAGCRRVSPAASAGVAREAHGGQPVLPGAAGPGRVVGAVLRGVVGRVRAGAALGAADMEGVEGGWRGGGGGGRGTGLGAEGMAGVEGMGKIWLLHWRVLRAQKCCLPVSTCPWFAQTLPRKLQPPHTDISLASHWSLSGGNGGHAFLFPFFPARKTAWTPVAPVGFMATPRQFCSGRKGTGRILKQTMLGPPLLNPKNT